MKTLRMDQELEARIKAAAKKLGQSESQFMREGIDARCDAVLSEANGQSEHLRLWQEAADQVSAAVDDLSPQMKKQWNDLHKRFPGGPARHIEEIFGEIVEEKYQRIKARRGISRKAS